MPMRKERALTSPNIALPNGLKSSMKTRAATTFPKETSRMNVKLIAVMGGTGSGKSSFINLFLNESANPIFEVGYGIEACTSKVRATNPFMFEGNIVSLIDTPGTGVDKLDSEIARMITNFLDRQYGNGQKLDGIIYLHRLSDHSVNGPVHNNLPLFMKLLGSHSAQDLLIVSNFWGDMAYSEAVTRETELSRNDAFFLPAVQKGAKITRHDDTYSSASVILEETLGPKQSMPIHKLPGPIVVTPTHSQDDVESEDLRPEPDDLREQLRVQYENQIEILKTQHEHDMRLQKENMEGDWRRKEEDSRSMLREQHHVEMDKLRQELTDLGDQLEASQRRERDLESKLGNLKEQTSATTASSPTGAKPPSRGLLARIFCCW